MLKTLHIENYALIDELTLEFNQSLNTITGETGAGKSILLGALGLLLGNRADSTTIKDESRNCIVEGTFNIGEYNLKWFFDANDLEHEPLTIIRRVVSPEGKSRAYINDLPVQLAVLKEFSTYIIDIHSQHQSLMIADDRFRVGILDGIVGHHSLIEQYSNSFKGLRGAERELKQLIEQNAQNQKDEEWLRFQVDELTAAKLEKGELEELKSQQAELSHVEEIREAIGFALKHLGEDEVGVLSYLTQIEHRFSNISNYYPTSASLRERTKEAMLELQDIERELSFEVERIDSDPDELNRLNRRLDTLYSLIHKHKLNDLEELIALQQNFEQRLALISDDQNSINSIKAKIQTLDKDARELAYKITAGRSKASEQLTAYVEKTLGQVGMVGSKFVVEFGVSEELKANGADDISFSFSANKNINPAPIEKIASGGELSRVMLAIKSLTARSSKLPTIIFDEIDAGVSGRIADAVGDIITDLSSTMQVINITHLPQVASKGEAHFLVYKDNDSSTTQTHIKLLSKDERISEIAKMLSGSSTTDAAIKQAKLLLGEEDTAFSK